MHNLTIRNFQSHKETQIELSPTVNSLEGVSDSGKSAVLRAMLWALTNKPDGTAFVSYWAKDRKGKIKAPVSVSIDNITRIRSEEFNGYIRYGKDGEERYEALKGAVPVEIERAINIGAVNIQRQMDPPFLLSSTPGDAARYVNSLVGLEEIDTYQKVLKGKSRDNANSLKDETARLAEAEKNLAKYAWVDDAKKKVAALEQAAKKVEALESDLAALASLDTLNEYDTASIIRKCDAATYLIDAYPDTDVLYADLKALDRLAEIDTINADLNRTRAIVQAAEPKINTLARIDVDALTRSANDLSALDEFASVSEKYAKATAVLGAVEPKIDALARIDVASIENALNTLSTALSEHGAITTSLSSKNSRIGAANALIEQGAKVASGIADIEATIAYVKEVGELSDSIHNMEHELAEVSAGLEGKACPICGKPL